MLLDMRGEGRWSKMPRGEGWCTLSLQYVMVTCLTNGSGVGGRGGREGWGVGHRGWGSMEQNAYERGWSKGYFIFTNWLAGPLILLLVKFVILIITLLFLCLGVASDSSCDSDVSIKSSASFLTALTRG